MVLWDLNKFLDQLNAFWKKDVYEDFQKFRLFYEFDIYAKLAVYFTRMLQDYDNLRFYINYGYCDLVLVELEDEEQRRGIKERIKNDIRNLNYEDLIKRYLVYFEIKFTDFSIEKSLIDIKKLHESLSSAAWKTAPEKIIFILFATENEFKRLHKNKAYQALMEHNDFSHCYLELRGYPDFIVGQERWGLFNADGSAY